MTFQELDTTKDFKRASWGDAAFITDNPKDYDTTIADESAFGHEQFYQVVTGFGIRKWALEDPEEIAATDWEYKN